jgi:hypothetical protein
MRIEATGAAAGDLEDYWMYQTGNAVCQALTGLTSPPPFVFKKISTLNCMYNVSKFFEPAVFGGVAYEYTVLGARLNYTPTHNTTFMTHTIDSSFADETVYFDMVADVEFTAQ